MLTVLKTIATTSKKLSLTLKTKAKNQESDIKIKKL